MTIISKENKILTLINVFSVDPANQQELVELLISATNISVRKCRGSFPQVFIEDRRNKSHDVCTMAEPGRLPENAKQ